MTATELREIMVSALVKISSGGRGRWRAILKDIRVYSTTTHAHCNWDVFPTGTPYEIAAASRAADALRDRHPFVDVG